jgi:hypothetical protein
MLFGVRQLAATLSQRACSRPVSQKDDPLPHGQQAGLTESGSKLPHSRMTSSNSPTKITSSAGGGAFQRMKCDGSRAEAAVVEMVRVELTAFVPGVTLAGKNEQVDRPGRLEQPSVMAPGNAPNCGVAVTL